MIQAMTLSPETLIRETRPKDTNVTIYAWRLGYERPYTQVKTWAFREEGLFNRYIRGLA